MKSPQTRVSRLVMRRIIAAVHERFAARTRPLVVHKLILLFCSIQAIVLSTHLIGNTRKPSGGNSFRYSTATPSLAHSLAHAIRAPLRGRAFSDARGDPRSNPGSSAPILCALAGRQELKETGGGGRGKKTLGALAPLVRNSRALRSPLQHASVPRGGGGGGSGLNREMMEFGEAKEEEEVKNLLEHQRS